MPHSLSTQGLRERSHSIKRASLHVPIIEFERKLVDMLAHGLHASMMISTMKSAREDGPETFNPVCVCHTTKILFRRMIDGLVIVLITFQPTVGPMVIRIQY